MKMEKRNRTTKTILITTCIILLMTSGLFIFKNDHLKSDLNDEKIRSEELLSEKLLLNKSIRSMDTKLTELTGKNAKLDKIIGELRNKLRARENEINKLYAERASVKDLHKQIADLEMINNELNAEIKKLNLTVDQLKTENTNLLSSLSAAQSQNTSLEANNTILKAMIADNYRVEALRGKHERLTINARRTDKLAISFELPANTDNGLYFKVSTPKGEEYSSKTDASATINIIDKETNLMASNEVGGFIQEELQRVEMVYKPAEKLHKGIYRFNIYNGDTYLGSTQMRLK